jgi:hypothetical protein
METRVWATAKRGMPAEVSRLVIPIDKTDFQFLRIIYNLPMTIFYRLASPFTQGRKAVPGFSKRIFSLVA